MEEILINVDSRYRDILVYPNECKFKYSLDKMYRNIISARMLSIEVNNSSTYLDANKQNNFITVHLPNKLNDPDGVKLQLDEGLFQIVGVIQQMFNGLFQGLFNTNGGLQQTIIDGKPFAEKYFYFFYLNSPTKITFDSNTYLLTLETGWYSVYGLVLQIQSYIKNNLKSSTFKLNEFKLHIFDRRFRTEYPDYDCVRIDPVAEKEFNDNSLTTNLNGLKEHIYQTYIGDTTKFIPQTTYNAQTAGILDKLNTGMYEVSDSNVYNYTLRGKKLESKSLYHLNIAYSTDFPSNPTVGSTQIYNLLMQVDLTALRVSFANHFTKIASTTNLANNYVFYYYYSPRPRPGSEEDTDPYTKQTWSLQTDPADTKTPALNQFDRLFFDKDYLFDHGFITEQDYENPNFVYSSEKDIPEFSIDFSTYILINPVSNGIFDVKQIKYPPVGYYLGFRPDLTTTIDQFSFTGSVNSTERSIRATKIFDTTGEDYMFLRINEWGYIDFFNKKMFAKILLTSGLGNPKLDEFVNKEYRFRQPMDINKFDIELVDWLGNTINLGGFDWSFTLELKQIINSSDKTSIERSALIFNNALKY
jgi:hypothetical protein